MKKRVIAMSVIVAAGMTAMGLVGCAGNKPAVKAEQPAAGASAAPQAAPAREIKRIALPAGVEATVNGTEIKSSEIDQLTKAMVMRNQQSAAPPSPEALELARRNAVDQLVNAELLYQAGQKLEIADLDKKLEEDYQNEVKRFPNPGAFEQALKSANMDENSFRLLLRKRFVVNSLLEKEIVPKVAVTDEEVKTFYNENLDKFKRPEMVRASHILVDVKANATPEEKQKAHEKAEALLKQLKEGKDFAELAKTESSCPSKTQGGDLNFFGKGQMVPEFEKAAFALKPGELSDVVETKFGYHIIKLTDRKPEGTAPLDEVKARIEAYLKELKGQQAVQDYVNKLKDGAEIFYAKSVE